MASVAFDWVYLHRFDDDLATWVRFRGDAIEPTSSQSGGVRAEAGGRRRIVTTATRRRSVRVVCEQADRGDVATLDGWLGDLLQYRDPRGRVLIGAVFELETPELPGGGDAVDIVDLQFTFHETDDTGGG